MRRAWNNWESCHLRSKQDISASCLELRAVQPPGYTVSHRHLCETVLTPCGFCVSYHGGLSPEEHQQIREDIRMGHLAFIYITPESFFSVNMMALWDSIAEARREQGLARFVIDEAHYVLGVSDTYRPASRLTSWSDGLMGSGPCLSTLD